MKEGEQVGGVKESARSGAVLLDTRSVLVRATAIVHGELSQVLAPDLHRRLTGRCERQRGTRDEHMRRCMGEGLAMLEAFGFDGNVITTIGRTTEGFLVAEVEVSGVSKAARAS